MSGLAIPERVVLVPGMPYDREATQRAADVLLAEPDGFQVDVEWSPAPDAPLATDASILVVNQSRRELAPPLTGSRGTQIMQEWRGVVEPNTLAWAHACLLRGAPDVALLRTSEILGINPRETDPDIYRNYLTTRALGARVLSGNPFAIRDYSEQTTRSIAARRIMARDAADTLAEVFGIKIPEPTV